LKRVFQKLKNRIHDAGSGLILVIVALGFVGVLVGALLTAVGYVYRMKLYDYNARDNFNYIEQAMDEVYAGIGSKVTQFMQKAYEDTLKVSIEYDPVLKTYKNIGDDEANQYFKDRFMKYLVEGAADDPDDDFLTVSYLSTAIPEMISNDTVEFTPDSTFDVTFYNVAGDEVSPNTTDPLEKIVIENVRLTREADYNRSTANGKFTQTLSTDIVIARPDFDVKFSGTVYDITDLFSYVMIADSGVEFNGNEADGSLTVNGNLYGASDFYCKKYNNYDGRNSATYANEMSYTDGAGTQHKFKMNKVSNYTWASDGASTLYNKNAKTTDLAAGISLGDENYAYNGNNDRSRYSGLYVDGRTVNLISDRIIVPGTMAVMNRGNLRVYGKDGATIKNANVWTDNIVIGGDSFRTVSQQNDKTITTKLGGQASFTGNLFVRDDTTIEADGTRFSLDGSYFGYSNSLFADNRSFIPPVSTAKNSNGTDINIYQDDLNKDNNGTNRSHYNSSAIIVNGQYASLNFSNTLNLYIAGRSYIELSRQKKDTKTTETETTINNVEGYVDNVVETLQYNPEIADYKTGESLAIRSTQLAYIPFKAPTLEPDVIGNQRIEHYVSELPDSVKGQPLFEKYFGENCVQVPVIYETEIIDGKTKVYTYFDFDFAAKYHLYKITVPYDANSTGFTLSGEIENATLTGDDLSAAFIKDYFDYLTYKEDYDDGTFENKAHPDVDTAILEGDDIRTMLTKVTNYDAFRAGQIALNNVTNAKIYASGAVTKSNVWQDVLTSESDKAITFSVITKRDAIESMVSVAGADGKASTSTKNSTNIDVNALDYAKEYSRHYRYLKWTLKDIASDYSDTTPGGNLKNDAGFIDYVLTQPDYSDESITPINFYMNFDKITATTNVNPGNLDLGDYKVWVSGKDVTVEDGDKDTITGIVVCKGDVYFGSKVKNFSGFIICGGKVFVNGNMVTLSSSELTINIINQCMSALKSDNESTVNNAKTVLSVFKNYEGLTSGSNSDDDSNEAKMITNIDYSDVICYDNWMKNVE